MIVSIGILITAVGMALGGPVGASVAAVGVLTMFAHALR